MSVPAERRGRTDIPGNVVAKIATRAAQEVDGVVEVRRRAGGSLRRSPGARVGDGFAALRLDVAVAYPLPLRSTADRIRRHVASRVHELTGLAVGHVDVDVASLVPGELVPGGIVPGGLVPAEADHFPREPRMDPDACELPAGEARPRAER